MRKPSIFVAPPADSPTESGELLERARGGDSRAMSKLIRRQGAALRRWAHGRLPRWARSVADTADLVQDVLMQTLRRIDRFDDRGRGALQAYLRQAVTNRIRDELRRIERRPSMDDPEDIPELPSRDPSPLESALDAERDQKYKAALATLTEEEQLLIVGRVEMGYSYEQLALISGRPTPEAARLGARRAVLKLAQRMSGA
jgi:RNA polymerase sigma-70 factor, ECF subfamily